MRILYCHDNFYKQASDGVIYSPGQFPYAYWSTFTNVFDHLLVAGRGQSLYENEDTSKMNISSGEHVSFTLFPNINTPTGLIKHTAGVSKRLAHIMEECDGVIIRAVSDIGWLAYQHARRMNKPIAMEMAACAWDSTWNHGNILGKLYAPIRSWRDKQITKNADYVIYVSQNFLQDRYPTNGISSNASNVRIERIEDGVIENRLARVQIKQEQVQTYHIGLIGNINNKIKGLSDAIHALSLVEEQKPGAFVFHHLGPGNPRPHQEYARSLGVEHLIKFDGMLQTGTQVLTWLDSIDLYIQPSYQEGVPRATIEAMSRACPVIGSTAGGIPELINQEWLHKPGDYKALAYKIIQMLESPKSQIAAATENIAKASNYTSDILVPRRQEFWQSFAEFVKESQE